MKILSIKNLLKSTLLATIFTQSLAKDFLKDAELAEIFQKTSFNVGQIKMTIDKDKFDLLVDSSNDVNEDESKEVKVKGKLAITINDETVEDEKTQFSIGGQSTRGAKKVNFNFKLDKKKMGRKIIRIRSAMYDPSFLRIKISTDILNRLGLKSISSNFVDVFANDEYMGLYVLIDAYKKTWLKEYYDLDADTKCQFFQCKVDNCDLTVNNAKLCKSDLDDAEPVAAANEGSEILSENIPLLEFMNAINEKKTVDELKTFMDVDAFIKCWIFEWLVGSIDHMLVNGKNYYLFRYNGVWIPLIYDFDLTFGVDQSGKLTERYGDKPEEVQFKDWYKNRFIVDELTQGDNEKLFLDNLQSILDGAFNPDLLIPHIDSLKDWISPYIKKDRTPDENGKLPGRINDKSKAKRELTAAEYPDYTYDDFLKNSEDTKIGDAEGLKKWIINKYKFVCTHYNVKCSSKYLDAKVDTTTPTLPPSTVIATKTTTASTVTADKSTIVSTVTADKSTTASTVTADKSTIVSTVTTTKSTTTTTTEPTVIATKSTIASTVTADKSTIVSTVTATKPTTTTSTVADAKSTITPTIIADENNTYQCGEKYGKCAKGYCCSKYGWCGKTEEYCDVQRGCQEKFGQCNAAPVTTTTEPKTASKDHCGDGIGSCNEGYCCSKYGWCGKSQDHCDIDKGCQEKYGLCKSFKPSTTITIEKTSKDRASTPTESPIKTKSSYRCGEEYGQCSDGLCCSKYGWCGKSKEYCEIDRGCQEKYGQCSKAATANISTSGRCGKDNGKCPDGYCCSQYGWCGKTKDHCEIDSGCQEKYGQCSKAVTVKIATSYRCGDNDGACPDGYCCSKYGWCGKTSDYCSVSNGCQKKFGKCDSSTENIKKSTEKDRCGEDYGKCPDGYCCSKYGWCGKTNDYCKASEGCQNKYGLCK